MTKREQQIKQYAGMLKNAICQEISLLKDSGNYTTDLALEYTIVNRSLENLLKAYEHLRIAGMDVTYYEFKTLSGEGLKIFKQKYGEVISVLEAREILGHVATETMIRTILHSSDYLMAVKGRVRSNNTQMVISKDSVLALREKIKTDPLGTNLLTIYRSPLPKEERVVKSIISLDEDLNKELEPYIVY